MYITPKAPATTTEKIRGKVRYTFKRVNMTNLPAQLTPGFMGAKPGSTLRLGFLLALSAFALGVGVLVGQMGGDSILALFLAGSTAGIGLLIAAIVGDQAEGDIVVTVCDSCITVQRGPPLLMAPARVSADDILSVMLTASFPGTFTAGGPGAAMRRSSAIVLQRRSMAPYVLISGCEQESLVPLAKLITERFGLAAAADCPARNEPPAANLRPITDLHPAQQSNGPHAARILPHLGNSGLENILGRRGGLDLLNYPVDYPDRRISILEQGGTLLIKVCRTSTFWQPTTLTAIILIEIPILAIAFTLGIWSWHEMTVNRPGHYSGPGPGATTTLLAIASAILLTTILAAMKGALIMASPQGLTVYSTFFWRRRRLKLPTNEIATFGVFQPAIYPSLGGAVAFHCLTVETKLGDHLYALRTCRLSQQQIGSLATRLRQFYHI